MRGGRLEAGARRESRRNVFPRAQPLPCFPVLRRNHDGVIYLDLSFIALRLAFTSFFTNTSGTGLLIGKLTMALVVA